MDAEGPRVDDLELSKQELLDLIEILEGDFDLKQEQFKTTRLQTLLELIERTRYGENWPLLCRNILLRRLCNSILSSKKTRGSIQKGSESRFSNALEDDFEDSVEPDVFGSSDLYETNFDDDSEKRPGEAEARRSRKAAVESFGDRTTRDTEGFLALEIRNFAQLLAEVLQHDPDSLEDWDNIDTNNNKIVHDLHKRLHGINRRNVIQGRAEELSTSHKHTMDDITKDIAQFQKLLAIKTTEIEEERKSRLLDTKSDGSIYGLLIEEQEQLRLSVEQLHSATEHRNRVIIETEEDLETQKMLCQRHKQAAMKLLRERTELAENLVRQQEKSSTLERSLEELKKNKAARASFDTSGKQRAITAAKAECDRLKAKLSGLNSYNEALGSEKARLISAKSIEKERSRGQPERGIDHLGPMKLPEARDYSDGTGTIMRARGAVGSGIVPNSPQTRRLNRQPISTPVLRSLQHLDAEPANQRSAQEQANQRAVYDQKTAQDLTNQRAAKELANQRSALELTNQRAVYEQRAAQELTNERPEYNLRSQQELTNQRATQNLANQRGGYEQRAPHELTNQKSTQELANQRAVYEQRAAQELTNQRTEYNLRSQQELANQRAAQNLANQRGAYDHRATQDLANQRQAHEIANQRQAHEIANQRGAFEMSNQRGGGSLTNDIRPFQSASALVLERYQTSSSRRYGDFSGLAIAPTSMVIDRAAESNESLSNSELQSRFVQANLRRNSGGSGGSGGSGSPNVNLNLTIYSSSPSTLSKNEHYPHVRQGSREAVPNYINISQESSQRPVSVDRELTGRGQYRNIDDISKQNQSHQEESRSSTREFEDLNNLLKSLEM